MSTNAEVAAIFEEMAAILELTGANSFRVAAHARVARVINDLPADLASYAGPSIEQELTKLEGIGPSSARKIAEYLETGAIADHQKLREKIPPGLIEVVGIPGLGPKTVRVLWKEGGVTDLASLKAKLDSGDLEGLPRMGAKTIGNIRESIDFAEHAGERARLGRALPVAEEIVATLGGLPGITRVCYAGSLRRGRETIGDLDILGSSDEPGQLAEAFRKLPGVKQVLVAGHTKVSIRHDAGLQIDLRIVEDDAFGAALMYFTGSKEHNVALRERAVRAGMRLNEYGLFPGDDSDEPPQKRGVTPIACRTEEEIYAKLDLPYIPPELREDRGELRATLPDLVELADIRSELHAHTVASDGKWSIEELAAACRDRGFHTVAVTDHSQASAQAGGLTADELRRHIEAVRRADENIPGIRILAGSEVDILADGRLDYEDDLLAELDLVVCSPHVALRQEPAKATERLLRAIRHPLVHVIGHPTGRVIGRRAGLSPDVDKLVEAAVEHRTALEINASSWRLDLRDTHVRAVVNAGGLVAIDTDAHALADLDQLRYGVLTARRGWLPKDLCVNTWPAARLHEWLQSKR